MSSIDFVKNIINDLVSSFPTIQCTYQYDISSNTHFIEVLPSSVYNLEKEYAIAETKATIAFIDKFPHEGICFITDDSIVKLEQPIYVKAGALFIHTPVPTFVSSDMSLLTELMSWEIPLTVGVAQNQSLYELLTSFSSPIKQDKYKYWTYSPNNEEPQSPPSIISDEAENELPLAA